MTQSQKGFENPPAGTVLDRTVTMTNKEDFYLGMNVLFQFTIVEFHSVPGETLMIFTVPCNETRLFGILPYKFVIFKCLKIAINGM